METIKFANQTESCKRVIYAESKHFTSLAQHATARQKRFLSKIQHRLISFSAEDIFKKTWRRKVVQSFTKTSQKVRY